MENIDDLMRQQYEMDDPNGRFPFREAYWEQALVLIEADEAQRKKRRIVLWWSFAGVLLAGALTAWWLWPVNQPAEQLQPGIGMVQTETATQKPVAGQPNNNTDQPPATVNQPNNLQQNLESPSKQSTNNTPQSAATGQHANQPHQNLKAPSVKQPGNHLQNAAPGSETSGINTKTIRSPLANPPQKTTAGVSQKGNAATNSLNNPNTPPTPVAIVPQAESTDREPTPITPENVLPPAEPTAVDQKSLAVWVEKLFLLPLPMKPVSSAPRPLRPEKVEAPRAQATDTDPENVSKFRFGVSTSAVAHHRSPNDKWLGATVGLFSAWQFHPNWSVNLGAQARYVPGDWSADGVNTIDSTLEFSYGFRKKARRQKGVGVSMLEFPISLQQKTGPISLELGVAPGIFLTSVYRVKTFEDSSLGGPSESAWLLEQGDNMPFTKYYLNAFAGIQYQVTPHLSVDLKGFYRFGRLSKEVATIRTLKPWGELGFKWRF